MKHFGTLTDISIPVEEYLSEDAFLGILHAETLDGLRDKGKMHVKRIILYRYYEEYGTKLIIITVDTTRLPDSVNVGYLSVRFLPIFRTLGAAFSVIGAVIRHSHANERQRAPAMVTANTLQRNVQAIYNV